MSTGGNFRTSGMVTYRKQCKVCTAAAARLFRLDNPGYKGTGKVTKYPADVRYKVSAVGMRVSDAKARAAKAGTVFNISVGAMYDLFVQQGERCALSGIKLTTVKHHKDVLSLDQIDPGKGYVTGNVQWLSWSVNRAKGDLSMGDFMGMCKAVLGRCNDYPETEYTQVSGSAQHLISDDIV